MNSSAPANRITSPWITTTMSRVIRGTSKESSAPPWYSAPNRTEARTTPAGWQRPISATAMPAKP